MKYITLIVLLLAFSFSAFATPIETQEDNEPEAAKKTNTGITTITKAKKTRVYAFTNKTTDYTKLAASLKRITKLEKEVSRLKKEVKLLRKGEINETLNVDCFTICFFTAGLCYANKTTDYTKLAASLKRITKLEKEVSRLKKEVKLLRKGN